jgi:hypothetical protein
MEPTMTGAADAEDQRKPHCAQVEAMAGYGVSAADIAQVLGIEVETLKVDYASQLDGGTSRPTHASLKASTARQSAKVGKASQQRSSG